MVMVDFRFLVPEVRFHNRLIWKEIISKNSVGRMRIFLTKKDKD